MNIKKRIVGLTFLCCASVFQTKAQETEIDSTDFANFLEMDIESLMNITVVSASKKEESMLSAASNIEVITADMIKEWGSRDIKDVVRRVTGYQVIADRDEWSFAARGNVSDNNQKYLILIDGVRMNSIENFGPGNIIEQPNNLSNIKRIEIIKGPGSAVWGADALAGVINIITKNVEDLKGQSVRTAISYGSNNFMVGDFQMGTKVGEEAEIMLMGSFSQQDGKEIKQSAATPWPYAETTYNDGRPYQYNTALDKQRFGYMLQLKSRVKNFNINAYTFETEIFNRHFEYGSGRENYLTTNKSFIEGQYNDTIGSKVFINAKIGSNSNYAEYRPHEQGDTAQRTVTNIAWRDRGSWAAVGAQVLLNDVLSLNTGVDYKFTKCGPNHRLNSFRIDSSSVNVNGFWFDPYLEDHQLGGYLMLDVNIKDKLKLSLGSRADYNNQRGDDKLSLNPRASIVVLPTKKTSLKALYNRGYLRPANFQAAGAKNVSSEIMNQVDIVWMHQYKSFSYSLTAYWQKLEGFINILPGFGFANTGDYSSTGIELNANYMVNKNNKIWFNTALSNPKGDNYPTDLAYNNQRVDLNGKLLSYAPIVINGGATSYLINRKVFVSPAVRFVGATKYRQIQAVDKASDLESNYSTTPNFVYVDLNIGFEPTERLGVYLYIDNVLNEKRETNLTVWNGSIGQYGTHFNFKLRYNF